MAADIEVIWVRRERKYFCGRGWTTQIRLKLKVNFSSARMTSTGYPGGLAQSVIRHWCPCQRKMADYADANRALRTTALLFIDAPIRFRFLRHGRASSRPSTSFLPEFSQDVDARDKSGHDEPCGKPMWADQRQRNPAIDKWKRRNTQPLFHRNCWPGFDGWLTRPNRTGGRSWRKGRAPGDRTSARSPGACARARTSGSRPGCLSRWRRSASTGHSRIP